ncbi:DUF4864 domain-containing protein [Roseobacter sp.]|uniref:DUF4864 domain-containing protein n=1 Tax=Roseobacter sp. TaxID=1907202 RepID=UPI00329A00E3
MRKVFIGLILALGLATALPAQQADIQATITRQFDAFRADDFDTAFEFASPNIQRLMRDPQTFERMVTQGYPMVWRSGQIHFLGLRQQGETYTQRVQITDQTGQVHLLDYHMISTDAGWRINGVQILESGPLGV